LALIFLTGRDYVVVVVVVSHVVEKKIEKIKAKL
jgi:hypothetical protein